MWTPQLPSPCRRSGISNDLTLNSSLIFGMCKSPRLFLIISFLRIFSMTHTRPRCKITPRTQEALRSDAAAVMNHTSCLCVCSLWMFGCSLSPLPTPVWCYQAQQMHSGVVSFVWSPSSPPSLAGWFSTDRPHSSLHQCRHLTGMQLLKCWGVTRLHKARNHISWQACLFGVIYNTRGFSLLIFVLSFFSMYNNYTCVTNIYCCCFITRTVCYHVVDRCTLINLE